MGKLFLAKRAVSWENFNANSRTALRAVMNSGYQVNCLKILLLLFCIKRGQEKSFSSLDLVVQQDSGVK